MIGQQLQWYDSEHRLYMLRGVGDRDQMITPARDGGNVLFAFGRHDDDRAAPREQHVELEWP